MKQAPTVSYGANADDLFTTLRRAPDAEPGDQVLVLTKNDQTELEPMGSWDTLGMRATRSDDTILDGAFIPDRYVARIVTPGASGVDQFKLEVAAALILRSVSGADEGQKVSDIYRALQTGFADSLASEPWQATYRTTDEVVADAAVGFGLARAFARQHRDPAGPFQQLGNRAIIVRRLGGGGGHQGRTSWVVSTRVVTIIPARSSWPRR